jgi:hypothetical protein
VHPTGYEVVKVVEQQHLEVDEDESGVKSMTMTSNPSLYVPGMGNVPIGDVTFHVSPGPHTGCCKACPLSSSSTSCLTV